MGYICKFLVQYPLYGIWGFRLKDYFVHISRGRLVNTINVGEVRLLVGHYQRVLFLFLSSHLSFSFSYFPLLGIHPQSTFALHLLAEFHDMPTSGMIKNYIVLNATYKRILVISGYISVVHAISMRLR